MSQNYTDWLQASDWKPLVANGVATSTKDGRKTTYKLVYGAMDGLLANALLGLAEADTVEWFKSDAMTVDYMVFDILGLPNIERSCPPGVDESDWLDPREGLAKVVKSRLRTQFDGPVQKQILDKGRILVGGTRTVEITTTTGHKMPQKVQAYAVTTSEDVVNVYAANPATQATIKQHLRKIKHHNALIDAVPEVSAVLIASLSVQATSAAALRDSTYQHAIEGMGPDDRNALDSKIAEAVQQSEIENGPELLALTGGSAETPEGEQD
jgi:hypothetical protein